MEENNKKSNRFQKTEQTEVKSTSRFSGNANNSSKKKGNYQSGYAGNGKENYFLLLAGFVVTILPLIVRGIKYDPKLARFDWFSSVSEMLDVFLLWKQWIFVGITLIMVLCFAGTFFNAKRKFRMEPIFIPLFVYGGFCLLSTILSKYSSYGWNGSYEQFENVFCLIGYVLIAYFVYLYINSEKDIHILVNALAVGALIIGLIGTFQGLKLDLFRSNFGRSLMASKDLAAQSIDFNFALGRAYVTLYNPNYVGVYSTLIAPFFAALLFLSPANTVCKGREGYLAELQNSLKKMETQKKKNISYYCKKCIFLLGVNPQKILYAAVVVTILISMFAAQFKAGIVSLAFVGLIVLVLFRKTVFKKWFITLPVVVGAVAMFFIVDTVNGHDYSTSIANAFRIEKTEEKPLNSIDTTKDNIKIVYNKQKYFITADAPLDEAGNIVYNNLAITKEDGSTLEVNLAEDHSCWLVNDDNLRNISFSIVSTAIFDENAEQTPVNALSANIDGKSWYFIRRDDGYKYINNYGRESVIETVDTAIFDGYEDFASKRGFIWARTIPLLKKYLVIGSGADTFSIAFPQRDYVRAYNNGYENQLISKPHCWYLQIGVQTGVVSLLAVLVFYGMYFIQSIRLYSKQKFDSYASQVGAAAFVGSIGYMISGLTNDSSITVAPVFWVLMGIGITVNAMVKREEKA